MGYNTAMTDAKARSIIATLAFALRDEYLPSKITDKQTSKEHTIMGNFSKSAFDFRFEDGTRIWGQATSTTVTAHVDESSQKISIDYHGEGNNTKITKAEDERNNVKYTDVDYNGSTLIMSGSLGRFEYNK
jgi:hypothetical protein